MINKLKGDLLENAVELIETIILKTNQNLENTDIKIERNKILNQNGIRHEIDLYIEINRGFEYKSIFIFECKNWDHKSVGKNEIIIFSEKIDVSLAQTGFFIAKKYSRYAEEQAKKDNRIKLLSFDDFGFDISMFPKFSSLYRDKKSEKIECTLEPTIDNQRNKKETGIVKKINISDIKVMDLDIDFKSYIQNISNTIIEKELGLSKTKQLNSGIYKRCDTFEIKLDNKLLHQNYIYDHVKLKIDYKFIIGKPKIVSNYDIKKRARILGLEFTFEKNQKIELYFVKLNDLNSPNNRVCEIMHREKL
jgi:hypothetical protein